MISNKDYSKNIISGLNSKQSNLALKRPSIDVVKFFETNKLLNSEWRKGNKNLEEDKIDIMVLTYNRLEYLKKCIWSIWNNTIYPFRLIVVNNGSTDKITKKFLEKLERVLINKGYKEDDFLFHHSKENLGTARGKMLGMSLCKGEVIAISDDDAWYNKGWLSICMKIAKEKNIVIVSAYNPGEPASQRKKNDLCKGKINGIDVVYRRTITPMHWVLKKDIIESIGFQDKKGRLMGYSGSPILFTVISKGLKVVRIANNKNEFGETYIIPMDTAGCSYNEIKRYKETGYNQYRAEQKGGKDFVSIKEKMPKKIKE